MGMQITAVLLLWVHVSIGLIEEIPLPLGIQSCFNRMHTKGNLTELIGEKVLWHCVHGSLSKQSSESAGAKIPEVASKWFADLIYKSLRDAEHRKRTKRQAQRRPLRVRREYRMLSDVERNLFHRAINMLKFDRSIPPNRYDALGRLHEVLGERAHDGPNFLGWHRLFLIVAENALREKVPGITIPYWDSTLDGGLRDPRSAIIWTPQFMGNGNGRIKDGPFRGWNTPITGPLLRNFGDGGTMMNWTSIRDTFSRMHLADISHPQADPKHNLEDHHGEPHLWVGGHMSPQALAGYDPIFLLHHSFIDLLWELFRRIQRRRGVDPTTDYPRNNTGPPGHRYNDPSGFGNLQNRHSLSDIYTRELYTYQLPPTCTRERPTCGSRYIRCDTSGSRPRCVSASIFDTPPDQIFSEERLPPLPANPDAVFSRRSRSVRQNEPQLINNDRHFETYLKDFQRAADIKCLPENVNDHYINNYNIDGTTDLDLWVYIPVNIIYQHNNLHFRQDRKGPATYAKCLTGFSYPIRVFVEANGINYQGFYKEISHIEKTASTASSIIYVGVRKPSKKSSEVMISAYDSCGRLCRPYCRQENNSYKPCAGTVRISRRMPLNYDKDIEHMGTALWSLGNSTHLPEFQNKQLFFKILCDDQVHWPWHEIK